MSKSLVYIEHVHGNVQKGSQVALSAAKKLGGEVTALVLGKGIGEVAAQAAYAFLFVVLFVWQNEVAAVLSVLADKEVMFLWNLSFLSGEVVQLREEGIPAYFESGWNWLQMWSHCTD